MATPGAQKYRKAFTMTLETREVWGPSQAVAPQGGVGLPEEVQVGSLTRTPPGLSVCLGSLSWSVNRNGACCFLAF